MDGYGCEDALLTAGVNRSVRSCAYRSVTTTEHWPSSSLSFSMEPPRMTHCEAKVWRVV
jgi:hypothetical protein